MKLIKNLVIIMSFLVLVPLVTCMGICGKAAVDVAEEHASRGELRADEGASEPSLAAAASAPAAPYREPAPKALQEAVRGLREQRDALEGVSFYYARSTPRRASANSFHAYIVKADGEPPQLRWVVQYRGDDWLFIEQVELFVDGAKYSAEPRFERDFGGGAVWEWSDQAASPAEVALLQRIAASKQAALRLRGRQYKLDRDISPRQKAGLRKVLGAYEALGGALPSALR